MELEQLLVGFLMIVIGGIFVVRPDIMMQFQIWTQKTIMGAQFVPSKRTYTIFKLMGALFLALGLVVISGIIR